MKKEKKYFLDTSFLMDVMNGEQRALQIHQKIKGKELTGTICLYELSKFAGNMGSLFQGKEILRLSSQDAEVAGHIFRELSQKGQRVGEIDTLIGGMVKNRKLVLVSRDQDFKKIPGIDLQSYEIKQ